MENSSKISRQFRILTFLLILFLAHTIFSKAQNAVGSVNGALTVNDMGAAVYSMTFDAPNGGRMTPKVGLAYSSQSSGYGLAGYGIDVTGISVITSGGRDMFHNGRVRGANYDKDSNFYLDGKRLVLQEGEDGEEGAVYSPEGDPYTKVTLHGEFNHEKTQEKTGDVVLLEPTAVTAWFEVIGNDGSRYFFGKNDNTRLIINGRAPFPGDRCAAWYINSAVNRYGESISYTYTKENMCIRPYEITYGTERGLTAKVEFSYSDMAGANVRTFRIGSQQGMRSKLLSSVTTSINNQVHRKYDFTYDETASDKFSRLVRITESNGNGESLNPTELTWKMPDIIDDITNIDNGDVRQKYDDGVYKDVGENNYLTVDLNGDGIAEIVKVCEGNIEYYGTIEKHIFLYVHEGYKDNEGNLRYRLLDRLIPPFFPVNFGKGEEYCRSIIGNTTVVDIDGDGLNDLVFPFFLEINDVKDIKNEYLFFVFGKDVKNKTFSNYHLGYFPNIVKTVRHGDENSLLATFDLNGNGYNDIIFLEKKGENGKYTLAIGEIFHSESGGSTSSNDIFKEITLQSVPKRLYTGDYNNDGLIDLIVSCENGYSIFFNNGYEEGKNFMDVFTDENSYSSTYSNSPSYNGIKDYWRLDQGDFDGDGLVDFFFFDKDIQLFSVAYNNGDGTFRIQTLPDNWGVYEQTEVESDDTEFHVVVSDFDEDGKSDILLVKNMYSRGKLLFSAYFYDKTLIRWLRSTGSGFEVVKSYDAEWVDKSQFLWQLQSFNKLKNRRIMFADFDGDGKPEISNVGNLLNSDGGNFDENVIHIYKFGEEDANTGKITSITDGYGNVTGIEYEYATNPNIYTSGESAYPVNSYTLPVALVSSIKSDIQDMSYHYEDLKIHIAGKGLLGFSVVETHENIQETISRREITEWDDTYWIAKKIKTTTDIAGNGSGNGDISTNTSSYTIEDVGNNWHSYLSDLVDIDFDGNTTYRRIHRDKANGQVVNDCQDKDEENDRQYTVNRYASEYKNIAGMWLPPHQYVMSKHPDDDEYFIDSKDYEYDEKGNVVAVVTGGSSMYLGLQYIDGLYHRTDYTYDRWGNVTSETFHGNDESTGHKYYEYDPSGRFIVKTYTVPESTTTTYTYDVFGNLLTETDETNLLHPLTTMHMYDNWGRREHTVNPDGTETYYYTEWEDDSNIGGWFTEEWHTAAPWVRVTYDSHGREVSTDTYGPNYVSRYQLNIYDKKGQIARTESINGKLTSAKDFEYDARGRVISEQSSTGAGATYVYDKNSVTVTDAAGRTVKKTYDAWGNVKSVEEPAMNIEYKYYSNGKPQSITTGNSTITMEYDELGRRTKIDDPDAGETVTTYYKNGQLKSETDGRGIETYYIYDDLGRITERRRKNTKDTRSEASVTTYTYGTSGNGKGRVTEKSLGYNKVTYEYDELGRVISETRPQAYNHDGTRDDMRKSYTYNRQGLLATVNYPASHSASGLTIGYRYDGNGYRTKTLLDNNDFNRLSWIKESNGEKTVVRSDYLGDVTTYYDEDGYPESDSYVYGNSIKDTLYYTWEKQTGNLISKTIKGKAEEYGYDNLDRLTDVRCNGLQTMGVDYADNGNIVYKTDVGEYTYDPLDKPHAVRSVDNTENTRHMQDVSFCYHPNGKLEYAYNKSNNAFVNYDYGPDDEKWGSVMYDPDDKEIKGWDIEHTYWGNYERLTKDYHIREYYFLDNDVFLIRDNPHIDAGEPDIWDVNYYQMERDNIGNIVAIYDMHHRKVFEAEYDAWGKQTVIKDEICFNHGFTGHEMLPQFGVIHMDGRLYDPTLGRFLSPDNYVQLPENSQSFNRYSYCINNPLKYTDPTGQLFGIDDAVFIFAAFNMASSMMMAAATGESVWKAAGISLLSSAASYGIGAAFSGPLQGISGTFGGELLRAGAHGLASGVTSALRGDNFGRGFMSGFCSSAIGSFASGIYMNDGLMLASCAAMGGLTEWALGGDFLQGAINGFTIGALNHKVHRNNHNLKRGRVFRKAVFGKNVKDEAYKFMIEHSQITGNEVSAVILENGDVYVFSDRGNTPTTSNNHFADVKGNYVNINGTLVEVVAHIHTHPNVDPNFRLADGQANLDPLRVSDEDCKLAGKRFDNQIFIITTGKQNILWKVYTNDEAHPILKKIY